VTSKDLTLLWYQDVKWQIIANLPQGDFTLDSQVIEDFIIRTMREELER